MFVHSYKRRPLIGYLPERKRRIIAPPLIVQQLQSPVPVVPLPPPPKPAADLKKELFGESNPGWIVTEAPVQATDFTPVVSALLMGIDTDHTADELIAVFTRELPNPTTGDYDKAALAVHMRLIDNMVFNQAHNNAMTKLLASAFNRYFSDQTDAWSLFVLAYARVFGILTQTKS